MLLLNLNLDLFQISRLIGREQNPLGCSGPCAISVRMGARLDLSLVAANRQVGQKEQCDSDVQVLLGGNSSDPFLTSQFESNQMLMLLLLIGSGMLSRAAAINKSAPNSLSVPLLLRRSNSYTKDNLWSCQTSRLRSSVCSRIAGRSLQLRLE